MKPFRTILEVFLLIIVVGAILVILIVDKAVSYQKFQRRIK